VQLLVPLKRILAVISPLPGDDFVETLKRSSNLLDSVLRGTAEPDQRATALAETLRALWPHSPLYVCSLRGEQHPIVVAIDHVGQGCPDYAESLRLELAKHTVMEPDRAVASGQLPRILELNNRKLAVDQVMSQGRWEGLLGMAVADGTSTETRHALVTLLLVCCQRLGQALELEALKRRQEHLEEELRQQEWLANLGELTGPVAHEVNNFLNSLLLQIAVLDQRAPEQTRFALAGVRRQGQETSAMLGTLQAYQNCQPPVAQVVDLNSTVAKIVQGLQEAAAISLHRCHHDVPPITLSATTDRLAVAGTSSDVKRLCEFLLRNAAAAASQSSGGSVTVRTERLKDRALLQIEDSGPAVSAAQIAQLFEPHLNCRAGTNSLELAASKTLARRLEGNIRAESGSAGGLKMSVSLPCR
jgi:signal transduction histidine kinase